MLTHNGTRFLHTTMTQSNTQQTMKKDMGGGALVLALAHFVMAAGLSVRLRALVPAVENAVAGSAYRPLDVLRTRAGITIEQVCAGGGVR